MRERETFWLYIDCLVSSGYMRERTMSENKLEWVSIQKQKKYCHNHLSSTVKRRKAWVEPRNSCLGKRKGRQKNCPAHEASGTHWVLVTRVWGSWEFLLQDI